jgi:type II secretion system protein H
MGRSADGFTLVELVMVFAVLGIAAAVAVPSLRSTDPVILEVAAQEVANALRFGRSEAMRTGEVRAVAVRLTGRIRVFKPDLSSGSIVDLETLTHPVDKKPYDFFLSDVVTAKGIEITNSKDVFKFKDLPLERPRVLFDEHGLAFILVDGTRHYLKNSGVRIGYGGSERKVSLSTIGRVTVE